MLERFPVFKSLHNFHIRVGFNLSKLNVFYQNIRVLFMSFIQYFENFFFFGLELLAFHYHFLLKKRKITSTETSNSEFPITKIYTDQSY